MMKIDKIELDSDGLPIIKWTKSDTYLINFDPPNSENNNILMDESNRKDTKDKKDEMNRKDTKGWQDLQLFYASIISKQLRHEIYDSLGYTSSTGIAHNKTLSKLISSTNKPNKQTCLLHADIMDYMKITPLTKIKGMGGKVIIYLIEQLYNFDSLVIN